MSDARNLANRLVIDTFATPAAILVALIDDPSVEVLSDDARHVQTLIAVGCLSDGRVTPLGQQVGTVLRTAHGLKPWRHGDIS